MTDDLLTAARFLTDAKATAELHEVDVQVDAYLRKLQETEPRTDATQDAIDALSDLRSTGSQGLTRSKLVDALYGRSPAAQLALIFAWGSGTWALWRTNTTECLQTAAARCVFDSNDEAIAFLLDPDRRFESVGSTKVVSGSGVSAYEAFVKLWCPKNYSRAVVPYAGTAFGTKLLYFAARREGLDERPLIYDLRVAKSLRALDVRWAGDGLDDEDFRLPTEKMPFASYAAYTRWCTDAADLLAQHGVTLEGAPPAADDIECWLWLAAGDIPPRVTEGEADTAPGTVELAGDDPDDNVDGPPVSEFPPTPASVLEAAGRLLDFCAEHLPCASSDLSG
jgi:hypothetical protein